MKLKQALVLALLTTTIVAAPAFAAEDAINDASQASSLNTNQKAAPITPAEKEGFHKKGQKDLLTTDAAVAEKKDTQSDISRTDTDENRNGTTLSS